MFLVPDEDIRRIGASRLNPILCIGCKKSLSKAPTVLLWRLPWDAISWWILWEVEKKSARWRTEVALRRILKENLKSKLEISLSGDAEVWLAKGRSGEIFP